MPKTRILGKKIDLKYKSLQNFFDNIAKRAKISNRYLHATTMYQTDDIGLKRNEYETRFVHHKIDFKKKRVFEVGCGTGRWAQNLYTVADSYLGIDFSNELIKLAKSLSIDDNCKFQVMSANNIEKDKLLIKPPYDIIICTGLCVYLNDIDVTNLIRILANFLDQKGIIYIREPISILEKRLTLKNYYSEEIGEYYNGIYRTDDEYKRIFSNFSEICLAEEGYLYDKHLHSRKETSHKYYILRSNCE